jgi:hypothetical protein
VSPRKPEAGSTRPHCIPERPISGFKRVLNAVKRRLGVTGTLGWEIFSSWVDFGLPGQVLRFEVP